MSENDILVVSETDRESKAAFVKFRELFFDCSWVKAMFNHPHRMFVVKGDAEILFVNREWANRYKVFWKGEIYPDSMINQVVRNKYGYS